MRRRILESPVTENIPNFNEISSDYPYLHFSDLYWYFGDSLDIYDGNSPIYIGDRINFDTGYSSFYYYSSLDNFEKVRPSEEFYLNEYISDFPYIQGPQRSVFIENTAAWSGGIMVLELFADIPIELIHTSHRYTIIIPIICSSRLDDFFNNQTYSSKGDYASMSRWDMNLGGSKVYAWFPLVYENTIVDGNYQLYRFKSRFYEGPDYQWGVGIRFHSLA